MMDTRPAPVLLVVSGPSGCGKTTLCRRLLKEADRLEYSVSCTTRAPRPGETDGADYRFLDEAAFARLAAGGAFLEHAEVHGRRYGTPRAPLEEALRAGRDVLLDIDVQGAAQLRGAVAAAGGLLRRALVDVFIAPPSPEALAERLRGRGADDEATMARRLANARREMARWRDYGYLVVNDRIEEAYAALRAILDAARHRVRGEETDHG